MNVGNDRKQQAHAPGTASKWRHPLLALASLAPFAIALTTYGLLLDHLQEKWFAVEWLRYVFAGLGALCVGFGLRLLTLKLIDNQIQSANESNIDSQPAVALAPLFPERSVAEYLDRSVKAVLGDLRTGHKLSGIELVGWSQYIGDDVPPTAIGTAYGLRILLGLDIRSNRVDRSALCASILQMQKPGGGWAASTQRDSARPEVTAWVLSSLVRCGLDMDVRASLSSQIETLMTTDIIGQSRTTVVTVVLSAMCEAKPNSPLVESLATQLVDNAKRTPEGWLYWGETLTWDSGPSAAHTSRAVVALYKAARALDNAERVLNAARAGAAWLSGADASLASLDEQVRRPMTGGGVDVILVGQFTSALCARALMSADINKSTKAPALRKAIDTTVESYENGVWRWHDGRQPIWMCYEGVMALREYALQALTWPA